MGLGSHENGHTIQTISTRGKGFIPAEGCKPVSDQRGKHAQRGSGWVSLPNAKRSSASLSEWSELHLEFLQEWPTWSSTADNQSAILSLEGNLEHVYFYFKKCWPWRNLNFCQVASSPFLFFSMEFVSLNPCVETHFVLFTLPTLPIIRCIYSDRLAQGSQRATCSAKVSGAGPWLLLGGN